MRRRSEQGTRNRQQRIENDQLDFLFTDISQHFEIYLMAFSPKFFVHGHG